MTETFFTGGSFHFLMQALEEMSSPKHNTRKGHLVHNLVDWSYSRDENLKKDFLSDSTIKQCQLGNFTQTN